MTFFKAITASLKPLGLCCFALTIAGCVTPTTKTPTFSAELTSQEVKDQKTRQINRLIEYQERIEQIGSPLLKAALPFCQGDEGAYIGMRVDNLSAWKGKYYNIAKDVLKLDEVLRVTSITPNSPAAKSGIEVGDMLVRINGKHTLGGKAAINDYRNLLNSQIGGKLNLEVDRNGERIQISIAPEIVCDYPIHTVLTNTINAYADGKNVILTSGLIRFADTDEEIAMVIAHEIAHNCKDHIKAKISNSSAAGVLDIMAASVGIYTGGAFSALGAQAFSKDFEREADYVGMYILARADVKLDGLEDFWDRMAAESPSSNEDSIFRSHPITAERSLGIKQTIAEIEKKKEQQIALLPY